MAVPGPFTLDSVTPGVALAALAYSQTAPVDSDTIHVRFKKATDVVYTVYETTEAAAFTVYGLPNVLHDFGVRGVNAIDGPGVWSNTVQATPSFSALMSTPAVEWNEKGLIPEAAGTGDVNVDNTGTINDNHLNTVITNGGAVNINLGVNGLPGFQTGGGGDSGITASSSSTINQPFTAYQTMVVDFVDTENRRSLSGDNGGQRNPEIFLKNDGVAGTINFTGIYGVGAIDDGGGAQGPLNTFEIVYNSGTSNVRIVDEDGQDAAVSGSVGTSNAGEPNTLGWNPNQEGNQSAPGIYLSTTIFSGVGSADERNSYIAWQQQRHLITQITPDLDDWGPLLRDLNNGNTNTSIHDIAGSPTGTWIGVSDSGAASRSTNSGLSWTELSPKALNSGGDGTTSMRQIATDGSGVWVIVTNQGWATRSTDDGLTWAMLPRDLGNGATGGTFRAIACDRQQNWVALGDVGVASWSSDNGNTWFALPAGLNSGNVNAQWQSVGANANGTFIATARDGWCSRSADGGQNWAALTQGLNSGSVTARLHGCAGSDTGHWVAVAIGGWAARSVDDGVSWHPLPQGLNSGDVAVNFRDVEVDDRGNWVAVGSSGWAAFSDNNGITWGALTRGLNAGTASANFNRLSTDLAGVWMACVADGRASVLPLLELPITGTGTVDVDAITTAATGTAPLGSDAAITLDAITAAATGTAPLGSDAAITLDAITAAATGTAPLGGDAAITLDAITAAATGSAALGGDGAVGVDDITVVGAGQLAIHGSADITLGDTQSFGSGSVDVIPPPPVVPPQSPSFQRMYEHLLPHGEAFDL